HERYQLHSPLIQIWPSRRYVHPHARRETRDAATATAGASQDIQRRWRTLLYRARLRPPYAALFKAWGGIGKAEAVHARADVGQSNRQAERGQIENSQARALRRCRFPCGSNRRLYLRVSDQPGCVQGWTIGGKSGLGRLVEHVLLDRPEEKPLCRAPDAISPVL